MWFKSPRPAELWRGETKMRTLKGLEVPITYVWARVEIGGRELILSVERDISEHQRSETALKESEQRFRHLIETADCLLWKSRVREVDGVWDWKFDVPVSGLRQRLFEAAKIEFDGSELWSGFNLPELATMDERCLAALKEREKSYRQEFRILLPNETMWLQEHVTIEPVGPNEWNLVGAVVDITRLKETEAAMRTSEERNRLVLRASNDGFWDFDVTANVMATSERCRSMLGLGPEATPQTAEAWRVRIHPDDLDVEKAAWAKSQATGEPCVYQARFRHEDGSWRWLMVRAITVTDESGTLKRVIGSHTDITELKRNDTELQQSRRLRALGELVGGIAHEFNNLLTPMLLQTTMMSDPTDASPELKNQLKPVISAIKEARGLTQRILTFGRRSTTDAESLELSATVKDSLMLRQTIDRRVMLNVKPAAGPLWIFQNRTDVGQIVVNLVVNARDTLLEKLAGRTDDGWTPTIAIELTAVSAPSSLSASSSGHVAAASSPAKPWHRLTVRDNGMGMTEEVRERIFEPFYTTKEVGQGTGLGLATVWHLIKTMGGSVEVETRLGVGSAFHVSFPPALPPTGSNGQSHEPLVAVRHEKFARILMVEDQPEVAGSLSRILESWGHRVTILTDGSAALDRLTNRANEYDVCITDLNLPGATGFEVVQLVRDRVAPLKVVVMGGFLTASVRQQLERLKVEAIVPKPFSIEDIESAMRICGW
jgi:two-component system, cell cycle sensor histidine kinase and response regulator CckA